MRSLIFRVLLCATALFATPSLAQQAGVGTPTQSTDLHATVTTGGTFQSILAFNQNRRGCFVQNPNSATEDLFVYFGPIANATTAGSVDLAKGAAVNCTFGTMVSTDQVSVTATTTGHAFVFNSQP